MNFERIGPRRIDLKEHAATVIRLMMEAKMEMARKQTQGGEVSCPVCKTGTIGFGKAPNEHTSGCCSTPDCVAWIE